MQGEMKMMYSYKKLSVWQKCNELSSGSCTELETQILLSDRLGYLTEDTSEKASELCDEINRKLSKLITSIKA